MSEPKTNSDCLLQACNLLHLEVTDSIAFDLCDKAKAVISELERTKAERDKEHADFMQAMSAIGEAGKILELMEEFWRNRVPIHAGSDLANEFRSWGQRVMRGDTGQTKPTSPEQEHALTAILDAAWDVHAFARDNKWPHNGSSEFQEFNRRLSVLSSALLAHKRSIT